MLLLLLLFLVQLMHTSQVSHIFFNFMYSHHSSSSVTSLFFFLMLFHCEIFHTWAWLCDALMPWPPPPNNPGIPIPPPRKLRTVYFDAYCYYYSHIYLPPILSEKLFAFALLPDPPRHWEWVILLWNKECFPLP